MKVFEAMSLDFRTATIYVHIRKQKLQQLTNPKLLIFCTIICPYFSNATGTYFSNGTLIALSQPLNSSTSHLSCSFCVSY